MRPNMLRTAGRFSVAAFAILFCHAEIVSAQKQRDNYDRNKCIIESRQYDVEITRNFDKKITRTETRLITGRLGDDYSTVTIPYQKGEKVTIHYARIDDMDGNVIRKLKNSDINEYQEAYGTMYSDMFTKIFKMLHNRHPYRLVYSYSVTSHRYIELLNIENDIDVPLQNAVVTLTVPSDLGGIKMRYDNVPAPTVSELKGATKYMWQYSYAPAIREVWRHKASLGIPQIEVIAEEFEYGIKGSLRSWESFGNWVCALNKDLDELPYSEKVTIDKILNGVEDSREKIKILYYYLQDNHRYMNVSLKTGGLKSHHASYVCANRYGDCKALSNYMKAALKYIGIESYCTDVWSGYSLPEFHDDFPSQAFNHVINVVPYNGDTIYLECTAKSYPFGYIHSDIQGRRALLTKESDSHLIFIPETRPEETKSSYNYDIDIDSRGNCKVHFHSTSRGRHYEQFSDVFNNYDKITIDKRIREHLHSGNFELTDYSIVRSERDLPQIGFTADFTIGAISHKYDNNVVITNFPINISAIEQPDKRRSGVEIPMPVYDEYMLTFSMPSTEFNSLPEPEKIESKYGTYEVGYSLDGGKLLVKKTLLINAGTYAPDEYPDFYDFFSRIRKKEQSKIIVGIL